MIHLALSRFRDFYTNVLEAPEMQMGRPNSNLIKSNTAAYCTSIPSAIHVGLGSTCGHARP
jgi:hypothetical protein